MLTQKELLQEREDIQELLTVLKNPTKVDSFHEYGMIIRNEGKLRNRLADINRMLQAPSQDSLVNRIREDRERQRKLERASEISRREQARKKAREERVQNLLQEAGDLSIGFDVRDKSRQIERLLDGGDDVLQDADGNKFVTFQGGAFDKTLRTTMHPDGDVSFTNE